MLKANKERCQGKNDKGKGFDVTSSPNSCQENSCERLEKEAANSPAQNASAENGAQEIYPWMKEFRSKGTKQSKVISVGVKFSPKDEQEQGNGRRSETTLLCTTNFCGCVSKIGNYIFYKY